MCSVADLYHFDTDLDPGSEKIRYKSGSGSRLNYDTDPDPDPAQPVIRIRIQGNYTDPDPQRWQCGNNLQEYLAT